MTTDSIWRQRYYPSRPRDHWIGQQLRRRISLFPLPSMTLTVETSVWPQRVVLSVTGLIAGSTASIYRVAAGSTTRTPVRNANAVTVGDTLIVTDAEAPFGVALTYILNVGTTTVGTDVASATTTLTLTGGKVALTDAITGNAAEVIVLAWPEKRRERASSVFAVGGRNIVVSGYRSGFTGTIDLFAETNESVDNILSLIDSATSGILQIRQAGPYHGFDAYISVQSDTETRWSQDGTDPRRTISLEVVETTAWGEDVGSSSTFSYADVAAYYTGRNYGSWDADFSTYLAAALGDYST